MGKRLAVLVPVGVLATAVLVFFNKMVLSNLILARGDTLLYFYPYWQAAADALAAGRVPLWNPDLFMGAPFVANSQVGFFYPLNWPLWLLLPTPYAVNGAILLHVLIAAVGTYLAGRRQLGLDRGAAILAGVLFGLGGYLTAQVEHVNQLQGLAWLPWFFAVWPVGEGLEKWDYVKSILGIGMLFGLQFLAGHTQSVFITGVGLGVSVLVKGDWRFVARFAKSRYRGLLILIVGGVVGVLVAAVQVLPTLELAGQSSRQGGLVFNEVVSFSLHPLLLTRALLPGYGQGLFTEYVAFLPLTALVLAVIGGWQWRRVGVVRPFLVLALVALFLALGQFNPLYFLLGRLPGFNLFRVPARWLVLYSFGAAMLAGYGWQVVRGEWGAMLRPGSAQVWGRRVGRPLRVGVVLLVGLMVWGGVSVLLARVVPVGAEAPVERPTVMMVVGWVVELTVGTSLIILTQRRRGAGTQRVFGVWLIPVLVLGVLFLGSRGLPYDNLTTPEAYFDLRPSITRIQAADRDVGAPKARFLSLSDIFFDPGDLAEIETIYDGILPEEALYDYTIAIKQKEIIAPNLPLAYGLSSVDGFDGGVLPLENYTEVTKLLLPEGVETTDGRLRENLEGIPEAKWLDLFGVRFIITDKVGDAWREVAPGQTAYFDLQHPQVLAAGESMAVGFVPDFEATALFLITSEENTRAETQRRGGIVDIKTRGGVQFTVELENVGEGLWAAVLPEGAAVLESIELTASSDVWEISGLTLVNESKGTFQSLVLGNYRLIHSGDVKIYENLDVMPRAFMVYEWLYRPSVSGGVGAMEEAEFDPRQQAVIVADGPERLLGVGNGEVEILSYEPERIEILVNGSEAGLLVMTEANYPGWQAEIDGERAKIEQADGLFRGVVVPAGEHEVVFVFRPLSYQVGLIISLLSLILLGVGLAYLKKARLL